MIIHEVCKRICEDCYDILDTLGKGCVFLDIDKEYCDDIYTINELIRDIHDKAFLGNE